MKHGLVYSALCGVILCGLAGCGRLVDFAKDTFEQGKDVEKLSNYAASYVKSVVVYDQFTTVGMFDALWLSDEVRTAYSNEYAVRRGKPEEFRKTLLRRQLEENNHFITFYVLSPFEYPLVESQSDWQLFLRVNGQVYFPFEFKTVELEIEYKLIFGKKYSRFKESYIVKFDAKNIEDQQILNPDVEVIELCFRSASKEVSLMWHPYERLTEKVHAHPQPQKIS